MSAFVIVDPQSPGSGRHWRRLEHKLATLYPYMSVAFLRHRGETAALVTAALREGHSEIVAVGGGTANDAINGFFDADGAVFPDAVLAFVRNGDAIEHLKQVPIRPIDIGRVRYLSRNGHPRTRYFATMASFGLSGMIVDGMNHSLVPRLFGRRFGFGLQHALGRLRYKGSPVRLIVDRVLDETVTISTVAVANGRVFGAPMALAPQAKPDDGQFDVVIHTQGGSGRIIQGRKVIAAPVEETRGRPVVVEIGGASTGRLPATFEILPGALNVRC